MDKYFAVQIKRLWKILPLVFLVMVLLLGSISLIYQGVVSKWNQGNTLKKVDIAVIGAESDPLLKMGLDALQTLDSSNMFITFINMTEEQAVQALKAGEVEAYVVFPADFIENAMVGVIDPLRFVSASNSENLVSMVKDELTSALASILISSECGSFGIGEALEAYGYDSNFQYTHINEMAKKYVEQVLTRDHIYEVEELGISQGLSFEEYILSGLFILFLFLLALPFAGVMIREDSVMERIAKSRGIGALKQTLCEFCAYSAFLFLLFMIPVCLFEGFSHISVVRFLPVVLAVAALSYLLYGLTSDLISGVLLQMVVSVAMCFVSGCLYPVYFFPISVQKLSAYLPAAIAREHIANLLTDQSDTKTAISLLVITVLCVGGSVAVRYLRIRGQREGKK